VFEQQLDAVNGGGPDLARQATMHQAKGMAMSAEEEEAQKQSLIDQETGDMTEKLE